MSFLRISRINADKKKEKMTYCIFRDFFFHHFKQSSFELLTIWWCYHLYICVHKWDNCLLFLIPPFINHFYYEMGINIWIYFANSDTLTNVKIKFRQKTILYFYAFRTLNRRKFPPLSDMSCMQIWHNSGEQQVQITLYINL
jgi:hypothetical protein